ncbi:chitinase [Cryptosporangium minutisporangium]|uniref:GH18 domain-containing protein n=1 Tax=Cryptosporangium minutisporangium TaxID=113569 RepID=A0ABP6SYN4_9ACTN
MARGQRRRQSGPGRWVLVGVAVVAAIAAAATVLVLQNRGSDEGVAESSTANTELSTVYAPYVYMTLADRPTLTQIAEKTGANALHLAFAITKGDTCSLTWDGTTALDTYKNEITAATDKGIEVIVSSGGAAGGEVAEACQTAEATQEQLQKLIDLGVRYLDFDVEGEERVVNATANTARAQAIAALQEKYADLKVSFTLAAAPPTAADKAAGAASTAPWVAAVDAGVAIDRINLMTMNFGGDIASQDMGAAATAAATGLHAQIQSIQGVEAAEAWGMVGITPMIGVNDVTAETFSLENAETIADFVTTNGVGMLSYWSVGRDTQCGADVTEQPVPTCSGVEQSDYAFASAFKTVLR